MLNDEFVRSSYDIDKNYYDSSITLHSVLFRTYYLLKMFGSRGFRCPPLRLICSAFVNLPKLTVLYLLIHLCFFKDSDTLPTYL